MADHQRVMIDVDDATGGQPPLGDLVDVRRGGDATADIEELADPLLGGQVAHGPLHEQAVLPREHPDGRPGLLGTPSKLPVLLEIVLATQVIVVCAGRMRDARVDAHRELGAIHDRHSTGTDLNMPIPGRAWANTSSPAESSCVVGRVPWAAATKRPGRRG